MDLHSTWLVFFLCFLWNKIVVPVLSSTPWLPSNLLFSKDIPGNREILSCPNLQCATIQCESTENRNVICKEDDGKFALFNLVLEPFLGLSSTEPVRKCWTKRLRGDFSSLSGVNFTASSDVSWLPGRKMSNLMDGFHNYKYSDLANTRAQNPYFVVDLGAVYQIIFISYLSDFTSDTPEYFHDLDTRIGNTSQAGNFSSYKQLDYFVGPGTPNMWHTIKPPKVTYARFVSVQHMVDGNQIMTLAHVNINVKKP